MKLLPAHSVVLSRLYVFRPDFFRKSATLFGQNDRALNGRTLPKDLQFSFGHGKFREAAMQTDHDLRKTHTMDLSRPSSPGKWIAISPLKTLCFSDWHPLQVMERSKTGANVRCV